VHSLHTDSNKFPKKIFIKINAARPTTCPQSSTFERIPRISSVLCSPRRKPRADNAPYGADNDAQSRSLPSISCFSLSTFNCRLSTSSLSDSSDSAR